MKKIFSTLVLTGLAVLVLMPMMVFAGETLPTSCAMRADPGIDACLYDTSATGTTTCSYATTTAPCALCCLMGIIVWVTNVIFALLIFLIIISVLLAAFQFITAAGDPEKITFARNVLMVAVVAVGLALLARAVPQLAKWLLGATS